MLYKKGIPLLLCLFLSGCGFTPLFRPHLEGKQPFTLTVRGEGYPAYVFRREIEKQLALVPCFTPSSWSLDIDLKGTEEPSSYAQTSTITRMSTSLSATYTLSCPKGNPIKESRSILSSYPVIPRDEFISKSADKAIKTRAMISLAQDVTLEIVRLMNQHSQNNPSLKGGE